MESFEARLMARLDAAAPDPIPAPTRPCKMAFACGVLVGIAVVLLCAPGVNLKMPTTHQGPRWQTK